MRGLARVMAAALLRSTALVPAERCQWAEAIWAEAAEVPAGWRQLSWLAGGLRLTAWQAIVAGRLWKPAAFAAAAGGVAYSAWSGPPGDPAIVINRVDVIAMAVILAGLPWLAGRIRGPAAATRMARLVRSGGYAAVLALVLAKTAVERVASAPPGNRIGPAVAWAGEIAFLAVMASYAAMILVVTTRRSPLPPATVATSTAAGVAAGVMAFALGPLGFPLRFAGAWPTLLYDTAMAVGVLLTLAAPVATGLIATRRASRSARARSARARSAPARSAPARSARARSRAGQGALAGLCTGAAAALAVAVLSTAAIATLPYNTGLRDWAAAHIGHWTPIVGQVTPVIGSRLGYVAGNSAFAAGYLAVLMISPLAGCALGVIAARVTRASTISLEPI